MATSFKSIGLFFGAILVVLFTHSVVKDTFESYRARLAEHDPNYLTAREVEQNLNCLAINIYREAGNEPFEGKVGVAQVTLNRAKSGDFAPSICGVVYQKNKFTEKVVCQFSWYCERGVRNSPVNQKGYDESYEVAKKVYLEGFKLASLDNALYYHADYINPNWRLKRITKIGHHIFYEG